MLTTKVLTFDQATSTGWAFGTPQMIDDRTIKFGRFRMPKRQAIGERLLAISLCFGEKMDEFQPDLVGYEEPFFPMKEIAHAKGDEDAEKKKGKGFDPETLKMLQMIKGVLTMEAARRAIPVESAYSASWRVTFVGYGRKPRGAEDDYMKRVVRQRCRQLGYEVDGTDDADAIGILYHFLTGAPAANRAQGDLLQMASAGL